MAVCVWGGGVQRQNNYSETAKWSSSLILPSVVKPLTLDHLNNNKMHQMLNKDMIAGVAAVRLLCGWLWRLKPGKGNSEFGFVLVS